MSTCVKSPILWRLKSQDMSDNWDNVDWPTSGTTTTTTTTVNNDDDDGWGTSSVTDNQTHQNSYSMSDPSRGTSSDHKRKFDDYFEPKDGSGFGRGIGRAKRMADWKESTDSRHNWNDSTRDTRSSQYSEDRSYGSYGSEAKRKFQISSSSVGKVIGKGGQTIRDLQSRSGAKINIMKDSGNSYDTDVQLSGTNEQIDCAQKLITDLISNNSYNSYQSNRNNTNQSFSTNAESSASTEEFIDWGAAIKESEEATRQKWESLPPIIKQFYFEDSEIRAMNPDLVDQFRLENNNIMVGHFKEDDPRVIPNPVKTFEQAFRHYREL